MPVPVLPYYMSTLNIRAVKMQTVYVKVSLVVRGAHEVFVDPFTLSIARVGAQGEVPQTNLTTGSKRPGASFGTRFELLPKSSHCGALYES